MISRLDNFPMGLLAFKRDLSTVLIWYQQCIIARTMHLPSGFLPVTAKGLLK